MKWIICMMGVVLFTSCKKNKIEKLYTIQGQIFESNSNPVPVSNYTLYFYQKANAGLLGGVSGFETYIKTGSDGKFTFQYNPNKNFGFSTGGTNPNEISIEGIDSIKYRGLSPWWFPVASGIDINLNTLYVFKKISLLVRKVQFNNSLNMGESLEVITPDSLASSHKTLAGPIAAGSLLIADTIKNCRLSAFNLLTREYNLWGVLKKPSYQKNFNIVLTQGDEAYREILMTY